MDFSKCNNLRKYSIMDRLGTSLLPLLLLAAVGFRTAFHHLRCEGISHLASRGQHAQALEKVNTYLTAPPPDNIWQGGL